MAYMGMGQNPGTVLLFTPSHSWVKMDVNNPLKMVSIGIDPYPYLPVTWGCPMTYETKLLRLRVVAGSLDVWNLCSLVLPRRQNLEWNPSKGQKLFIFTFIARDI